MNRPIGFFYGNIWHAKGIGHNAAAGFQLGPNHVLETRHFIGQQITEDHIRIVVVLGPHVGKTNRAPWMKKRTAPRVEPCGKGILKPRADCSLLARGKDQTSVPTTGIIDSIAFFDIRKRQHFF